MSCIENKIHFISKSIFIMLLMYTIYTFYLESITFSRNNNTIKKIIFLF